MKIKFHDDDGLHVSHFTVLKFEAKGRRKKKKVDIKVPEPESTMCLFVLLCCFFIRFYSIPSAH